MLYKMSEVLELVRANGFRKATELAYDMRLEEIGKSWLWPHRIVTVAFGFGYFALLIAASIFIRRPLLTPRITSIIRDLSELYYYIPEIVIFKGVEIDAVCRFGLTGRGLDLGCGNGRTGTAILKNTDIGELHGLDRSFYFAAHNEYSSYLLGDARCLPYRDESFNFIISLGLIDHVADLDQLLNEARRVLKPGGKLIFIIQTPRFRESTLWHRLFHRIGARRAAEDFKLYRDVYDMIFHYYSEEEWSERLKAAGFSSLEMDYVFSRKQLLYYDLLNMQTYFLKFYFAQHVQLFLNRRTWLQRLIARATSKIAGHLLQEPASRDNATRYLFAATK